MPTMGELCPQLAVIRLSMGEGNDKVMLVSKDEVIIEEVKTTE
jgi:hypothetical protein